MSLYQSAIAHALSTTGGGYKPRTVRGPSIHVVKVTGQIPTPHGPVIAGEVMRGEYLPPGSYYPQSDVGFSFKKLARGVGKGFKKAGKAVGKAAKRTAKTVGKDALTAGKLAYKYHPLTLATKGAIKLGKPIGKTVLKGSKKAVKWVRKNPVKALAIATGPAGLASYAAFRGGKAIKKAVTKKARRPALAARPTMPGYAAPDGGMALPPPPPSYAGPSASVPYSSFLTEDGMADAASLDAADDSSALQSPESYPYEGSNENETPDALSAPEPEDDDDTSNDEDSADDASDDASDDNSSDEDAATYDGAGDGGDDSDSVQGDPMEEEYVGYDEIAGDGDEWVSGDEIAGTSRALARRPGPNAALIRKKGYSKKRRQPLPINSVGTIAAAASAVLTVIPQTLFRGRKIVIGSAIAASFTVDDVKVGNVSQMAASGSVSGEAFGPTTTGEDNIQMDTCPPGMTISMSVTNVSGGALTFRATIFGDSVQ